MECFFSDVVKKLKERGFVPREGQDDFDDFLIREHQKSLLMGNDSDDAQNEDKNK